MDGHRAQRAAALPFRQHSSRGDPGGAGEVAPLKLPGQCPHRLRRPAPEEGFKAQKAARRAGPRWCQRNPQRGHDTYKETGQKSLPRSYLHHLR